MSTLRLGWTVFFVAAGLLGFELSLMRVLLVASWHHFAFLVISIALLGFGASGTALSLLRKTLLRRSESALFVLVLVTAVSMPVCMAAAQHVPVEARVVPATLWRQIGCWTSYWALLGVPFLLGAAVIGLALMVAGRQLPRVYAANLIGSAAGLMLATAAMNFVPPQWLPLVMGGVVLVGAAALIPGPGVARGGLRLAMCGACVAVVAVQCVLDPPGIRLDPFKFGAYVRRLERQHEARRVAVFHSPRAALEAWSGAVDGGRREVFHHLPFLSVQMESAAAATIPPPMTVLVADGHLMGSVLDVARAQDAGVMDHTMMAVPYVLMDKLKSAPVESRGPGRGPRVLLLGETGGTNIWLAARHGASEIQVVQPDANVTALLRGPLRSRGGAVLDLPMVNVVTDEPRHFVERTRGPFDVIQLVALESLAAGSGGVGGLAEDHLLTVEGIGACLGRLGSDGLLFAARGIQSPPRDNVKLLATFVVALHRLGVEDPQRHVVIVRDYLAVCTIAKRSPWTPAQIERVRRVCRNRELTPVWFPGVRPEELNQPDVMDTPPGEEGDWLHHAARQLFSASAERFIRDWPYNIRPPTDERPFFMDFCKLTSFGELKRTFGDLWLTRMELAFPVVLAAVVMVSVAGAVLTLLPLFLVRIGSVGSPRAAVALYFASIGLGYMLLEMTFLSRLTRWVGDPVTGAAVTIGGFLLASGVGSLSAQRAGGRSARLIPRIVAMLIVIGAMELLVVGALADYVGSLPLVARCALCVAAIAPMGYLMGFPMPLALARLNRAAPAALPWAWGINGFASVVAAPVAVAIGMTWGYSRAGILALLLYFVPALLFTRLPGLDYSNRRNR